MVPQLGHQTFLDALLAVAHSHRVVKCHMYPLNPASLHETSAGNIGIFHFHVITALYLNPLMPLQAKYTQLKLTSKNSDSDFYLPN